MTVDGFYQFENIGGRAFTVLCYSESNLCIGTAQKRVGIVTAHTAALSATYGT